MSLEGKVCLVTGATRGIGKGIALQLGEAGAIVYITGRTLKPSGGKVGGSLEETAQEVNKRGGRCISVQCDHGDMKEVESLFEHIKQEQDGRLDVLVNNAYSAVNQIMENAGRTFWDTSPTMWDDVNNVGLRNHYFCCVYAARMMVPRKQGLIVNVSSLGGMLHAFNVAYGVGKEALDRMAVDCALELRKENVACVSLWPGAVKTEEIMTMIQDGTSKFQNASMFEQGETTEFPGQCVVRLALDANIMSKSGRILMTADLAEEYGLYDSDGSQPSNWRSIGTVLTYAGHSWLGAIFPRWIKMPKWVFSLGGNKF